MSLKAFHFVFVGASLVLALSLGVWSLSRFGSGHQALDLVYGVGWLAGALALLVYGRSIMKKLRHLGTW